MENNKTKTVYISKEGCSVFPHLSLQRVLREDEETYYTFADRFPKNWAEEVKDYPIDELSIDYNTGINYFSYKGFFTKNNHNWNKFRSLGYITDTGERNGYFSEEEYQEFEKYSLENSLDINKYS